MENTLLKKLQIKPGFQVGILGAPDDFNNIIGTVPDGIKFNSHISVNTDGILIFATSRDELAEILDACHQKIGLKTICWIIYPKAKTKLAGDLNLMKSWDNLKAYKLSPCASAAINDVWTAIRIRPEEARKKSGLGNAEIVKNDYGEFIDVANKTVKLPADVQEVLAQHPEALSFYKKLAYSHRKEYILWIISAKQEKTRNDRIGKMLEKLLNGQKN